MFPGFDWFAWVFLPLLIFIARVVDVSMGTIRILFLSKGVKIWAAFIAFFEILIWLLAVTEIIKNLSNPVCYIAYCAGFASGTYLGMIIEERLAYGKVLVQVISPLDVTPLIRKFGGSKCRSNKSSSRRSEGRSSNFIFCGKTKSVKIS